MARIMSKTPDSLDLLLADYFRPQPVSATLGRRIADGVRHRREALEDLLARLSVQATERGVSRIHRGRTAIPPRGAARRFVEQARQELVEFLGGSRVFFSVPIDLSGLAPFQREVLREAARIPYGEVRAYSHLAERIGSPRASRAVGTALGHNPVPFFVPCHRVVRRDGSLGGYGLGLELKRRLLELERKTPILEGCTSTGRICRVGCASLRRVHPDRRVVFASVADARSVGYRPCLLCRPDAPAGRSALTGKLTLA